MAGRRTDPEIYVAKHAFSCEVDGVPMFVNASERVRRGHPLLRSHASYFEPADATVHYDVEQATAAPGEKRGLRLPA